MVFQPLNRTVGSAAGYSNVTVEIDRAQPLHLDGQAPTGEQPSDIAGIEALGADWFPLVLARRQTRF